MQVNCHSSGCPLLQVLVQPRVIEEQFEDAIADVVRIERLCASRNARTLGRLNEEGTERHRTSNTTAPPSARRNPEGS
jgi:hypothetical protein